MPDFLTRRNGTWHFVRRVPVEFLAFDPRRVIRHSTKIRIQNDRNGRKAARVAETLNAQLERHWQSLARDADTLGASSYNEARRRARTFGFEYLENSDVITLPLEKLMDRIEALGRQNAEPKAAAAILGTEPRPAFKLSRLFEEYEELTKDETMALSPDQLRIWRNGRSRAAKNFREVVGDKDVSEVTADDGVAYTEWWRKRVVKGEASAKTANKNIGQLSRMLKVVSLRKRLHLADIFKGLKLRSESEKPRVPYETDFLVTRLFAKGALDGLNEEARDVLRVMLETGMRPSEIVNLLPAAIRLDDPIPHVKVQPDGRKLKTDQSERDIPLVGIALKVMKRRPNGFPKYRDRSSSLSATLNKFLGENNLRPTPHTTVYSLRHSFKDRLVAAQAPDSLIDNLMGHKTYKPRYGKGPGLDLKLKFLSSIALKVSGA